MFCRSLAGALLVFCHLAESQSSYNETMANVSALEMYDAVIGVDTLQTITEI